MTSPILSQVSYICLTLYVNCYYTVLLAVGLTIVPIHAGPEIKYGSRWTAGEKEFVQVRDLLLRVVNDENCMYPFQRHRSMLVFYLRCLYLCCSRARSTASHIGHQVLISVSDLLCSWVSAIAQVLTPLNWTDASDVCAGINSTLVSWASLQDIEGEPGLLAAIT